MLTTRWVVFFATLRIAWGYEQRGYTLAGRRYLPDFELSIKRGLPRQLARELLEAYKQQAGPLVDEREPDRYRQWAEELVRKCEQALGDKQ